MATYTPLYNARPLGTPRVVTDESHVVGEHETNRVWLVEVPLEGTLTIERFDGGSTWTALTETSSTTPSAGQFHAYYEGDLSGAVEFNTAENADTIRADYSGVGSPLPAHVLTALQVEKVDRDGSIPFTGAVTMNDNLTVAGVLTKLGATATIPWTNDYRVVQVGNRGSLLSLGLTGSLHLVTQAYADASNWRSIAASTAAALLTMSTAGFTFSTAVGTAGAGDTIGWNTALTLTSSGAAVPGRAAVGPLGLNAAVGLQVRNAPTTGTTQYGIYVNALTDSTADTAVIGIYASVQTPAATFTTAESVGIRLGNHAKGAGNTITTAYGLKIDDITAGVTSYSIYTGSTPSRFGGQILGDGGAYLRGWTTPTVGAGLIMGYTGGESFIHSYNYATPSYANLYIRALALELRGDTYIRFMQAAAEQGRITNTGLFLWGTTITSGAAAGEIVLAVGKALRSVNTSNATVELIRSDSTGAGVVVGGGTLPVYIYNVPAASFPAGAGNVGIIGIDTTNNRFVFYSGGNRYYVNGTAF